MKDELIGYGPPWVMERCRNRLPDKGIERLPSRSERLLSLSYDAEIDSQIRELKGLLNAAEGVFLRMMQK